MKTLTKFLFNIMYPTNCSYSSESTLCFLQEILQTLEEEARQQSLKPKQMRVFQPKTDNLLLTKPDEAPVATETVEEINANDSIDETKKNSVLSKLGTRGRGKKPGKK